MSHPTTVLLVRFSSPLSFEEVQNVINQRIGEFRALRGLTQKYYLQDEVTGEYAGLYLWESPEALDDFRDSELRKTIARAYQAEGQPRIEVYKVFDILRP